MLMDRPIVVVECPRLIQHARINPDKVKLLQSAAIVVRRAREVPSAVCRALAQPGAMSAARRQIASDLFYKAGTATLRAARAIYELLELEAPADSSVVDAHVGAQRAQR
jgi:hypothetical protein